MKVAWIGGLVAACVVVVVGLGGCGKSGPSAESLEGKVDAHGDEIMASATKGG